MKAVIFAVLFAAVLLACTSNRVQQSCAGVAGTACPEGYECNVPSSEPDALGTCVKAEPIQCGGIRGAPCPDGFTCKLEGNYPDAGGTCVQLDSRIADNPSFCEQDTDCVRQDIACDCGAGTWVNKAAYQPLPPNTVRCKCATREAIGVCEENKCIGKLVS